MLSEEYVRSIEARLKLQDQLIQHLFLLLYGDEPAAFAAFMESQMAGLAGHHGPNDERHPVKSEELKMTIKAHLESWGNRTTAAMYAAQAVRQARPTARD